MSTPFGLVRLSKSKEAVDVSPNTIRAYVRKGGIKLYRKGKSIFFSPVELEQYIRGGAK